MAQIINSAAETLLKRPNVSQFATPPSATDWHGRFAEAALRKGPFRRSMEDTYAALELPHSNGHKVALYLICDGHSGTEAASFFTVLFPLYVE